MTDGNKIIIDYTFNWKTLINEPSVRPTKAIKSKYHV